MLTDGAEITTSESRSSTRGTLFAIRHIWTIEHFSFLLDEKLIESAIFHHEEHDEFKWKIELDPQGSEEDYKDYISLYLFLDSCSKRNARAFVKYSFLDAKKEVIRERELSKPNEFSPGGNWGFGMFMKRDQLLDHLKKTSSNVLSVRVELEVVIDIVTSPSYILAPKTEITDCRASEISSGVIGYRMPADVVLTVNGEKCDASKTGLVAGCPQVFTEMLTQGTKTKYYMAQCYQHLDDPERSAIYCHLTLKKQLKNREFLSFFDPVDWAVSAATLSQFFLCRDNFSLALHLLACAEHMLYMTKLETPPEDTERFQWRSADVARCWIKYCVVLLESSKDLKNKLDDGKEVAYPPTQPVPVKMIDHEQVEQIESQLKNNIVKTFDEARQVFLEGQKKVSEATSYYSLQDRASDYVLIAQDSSKLYRDLAVFETQNDRKCKMHKRRIDLLEEMVKILNPKYYSGELQQLHFELAEVYTEMMDLKYACLPKGMLKPTDGPVNKINLLTRKAIFHYKQFLNLIETFVVKDSAGADKIAKYEDSYVRPALVATFSIGRLESKFIVGHPREQLENLEKSKKHYEYVDSYIKKYPEHAKFVEGELEVMRELMELLPQTIQNVISSTVF